MSSAGLADGDLRVQCSALEGDGHDVQCVRLEGGNALRADHVDEPLACGKRTGDVRVLCWSSSVSYQGWDWNARREGNVATCIASLSFSKCVRT